MPVDRYEPGVGGEAATVGEAAGFAEGSGSKPAKPAENFSESGAPLKPGDLASELVKALVDPVQVSGDLSDDIAPVALVGNDEFPQLNRWHFPSASKTCPCQRSQDTRPWRAVTPFTLLVALAWQCRGWLLAAVGRAVSPVTFDGLGGVAARCGWVPGTSYRDML